MVSGTSVPTPNLSATLRQPADAEYDHLVGELVFDKRSKPADRTKTEEELALEAKEHLEAAERRRLRRMRGDEEDTEEEGGQGRRKRRKAAQGGDDLEDSFAWSDHEQGFGSGLAGTTRALHDDDSTQARKPEEQLRRANTLR